MGCRNACICGGRCSESCYEPERYCGEAEDLYDELHSRSKKQEEYYSAMEEEYYSAMEDKYYEDMARQVLADENASASDKDAARQYLINMGVLQ